ncbi:MAG: ACP S-malonyltransferase [Clostridia bacterium]|nr:ACP S-malonyltransferase [Clostridia bacterium]
MIVYVFPGQGSQQKGMGGSIFNEFSDLTAKADAILGYSIKELCMEDSGGKLGQTQYTQPALYIVNALSYLKKVKDTGVKPDYVAGHSLGEYNALFAAGVYDFETGLKLVKRRGELMSQATGGGMAAIIGLSEEKVKEVLEKNNLHSIDAANFNTLSQIVVSGPKEDIEKARPFFEAAKSVNYVVLKVSGAFHSRYMEQASKKFEEYLDGFTFSDLKIPVISNVYARPYKNNQVKRNLVDQIKSSVKWTETIRYLMGKGEVLIEQIGPGAVLKGMVNSIQREAEPLVVSEEDWNNEEENLGSGCSNTEIVNSKEGEKYHQGTNESLDGFKLTAEKLGCSQFKNDYNLKYAYLTGGMYRGVASKEMVVKMGRTGMMGFMGTGGLDLLRIEDGIRYIQKELSEGQAYGINLLHNPNDPAQEEKTVDLLLRYGVRNIEAAAFLGITSALVKYRAKGLRRDKYGNVISSNRIIAKLSRPEVAEAFLSPAPERILTKMLDANKITKEEAGLLREIPMADDICAEADSGGHTDSAVAYALMPAILKLRDDSMKKYGYHKKIRVGAAGGIGTPQAAAAAFVLGADFIMTGSINQCTVEAATSDVVKDLLQQMNVQDTEYAPAGDMFELGAKVQVLKKGLFFPARANKLYDLYRQYNSIDEIDEKTKNQIQEKYFKCSFEKVYEDIKAYYPAQEIEKAEKNPKHKMALIFRWYFGYSSRLALEGNEKYLVDFQIHCGPALGAFNQWVKGTGFESWRNRHVDEIANKLMNETAVLLNQRFNQLKEA